MDQKKWDSFTLVIFGREITGIESITVSIVYTLDELNSQLQEALDNEDYLKCAELKKKIDNFENDTTKNSI